MNRLAGIRTRAVQIASTTPYFKWVPMAMMGQMPTAWTNTIFFISRESRNASPASRIVLENGCFIRSAPPFVCGGS